MKNLATINLEEMSHCELFVTNGGGMPRLDGGIAFTLEFAEGIVTYTTGFLYGFFKGFQ